MVNPKTGLTGTEAMPQQQRLNLYWIPALAGIHLGAVAALWETNWAAVGVCLLLHEIGRASCRERV